MIPRKRLDYVILTVIYTLCVCAVVWIFLELYSSDRAAFILRKQADLKKHFSSTMFGFKKYSRLVFRELISRPDVKKLISSVSPQQIRSDISALSAGLRRILLPVFRKLQHYIFSSLEIYSPSGKNLLYLNSKGVQWNPNRIPCDSVGIAGKREKSICGFEWCVEGGGFSFLYPLFRQKQHLGTVVLRIPHNIIIESFSRSTRMRVRFAMLRRPFHARAMSSKKHGGFIEIVPGIILQKERAPVIPGQRDSAFFASQRGSLRRGFTSGRFFMVRYSMNSRSGIIYGIPQDTIAGKRAGYLLYFDSDRVLVSRSRMYLLVAGLIILILTLLAFFAFYVIRTRDFFRYQSSYDKLTGAFNRISFKDFFEREAEKSRRYGSVFSLILFDIDHLSEVNGKSGREAGDDVLRHLGEMVRDTIRKCDYFVRWGGGEFLILLPETELSGAVVAAEKLRLYLRNFDFSIGRPVTASFGVCRYQDKGGDVNEAVDKAVERLAEAKKKGGDRISVCDTLGV